MYLLFGFQVGPPRSRDRQTGGSCHSRRMGARLCWIVTAAVIAMACTPRTTNLQCTTNSDCTGGLICLQGACRQMCRDDSDCRDPRIPDSMNLRCVLNAGSGLAACVLPDAGGPDAQPDSNIDVVGDAPLDSAGEVGPSEASVDAPSEESISDSTSGDVATDDGSGGCSPPTSLCGTECVNTMTHTSHCGRCSVACPSGPANSRATCVAGVCGWECDAGFYAMAGTCVPAAAPRAIAPSFGATSTSRRSTFRWELLAGSVGAQVDVCADVACSAAPVATFSAAGTFARPAADLPPGMWFWRLRPATAGGVGTATSRARPLRIPARSAPVDAHWGSLLDLNLDGLGDLAVTSQASPAAGPVTLYVGSRTQVVSAMATVRLIPTDTASNPQYFGYPCVSAGDVNGDAYPDIVCAAGGARMNQGTVYVFHGSASGIASAPTSSIEMTGGSTSLGFDGLAPGDFDGDGYTDIAIGAQTAASGEGRVFVYRGSSTGLVVPGVMLMPPAPLGTDARFGTVAAAGDVNGDGLADIVVSAPGATMSSVGRVYVYLGGTGVTRFTRSVELTSPAGPQFGLRVAGAGDVNGDGYCDVLVAAPGASLNAGRVWVYFGGPTGTSSTFSQELAPGTGAVRFGTGLAGGGDVNGDGYSDVVVGEPNYLSSVGRVSVYLGSSSGLVVTSPQRIVAPAGAMPRWGDGLSIRGDFDGDGLTDLAVGGNDATASSTGRIHILRGVGPDAISMSPGGVVEASPTVRDGPYQFGQRIAAGQ